MTQVYFRKLGGVKLDTPDLGPVKKLGMGRRTGEVVKPPKAAAALPALDFEGGSMAAEFGNMTSSNSSSNSADNAAKAVAALQSANGAAPAAPGEATPASGNGAAPPASEQQQQQEQAEAQGIVGGLEIDQSMMDGVAKEELEFLERRCKRRRRQPTPA